MMTDCTIVLVHGLTIVRDAKNTFVGVREALQAKGFRVHQTHVQGDGSLDQLAERVWQQIDSLAGPLVLLCHSMGGLQARTFLLNDNRAARLHGIATVGSPHHGTPLARYMGSFGQAYRELTPVARQRWQDAHGEAEQSTARRFGVRCLSVVASLQGPPTYGRMRPTQMLLRRPNDGLVPADAQQWGHVAFEVDLDHVECACVEPPSPRVAECVGLWVRLAERATSAEPHAEAV